MQLGYFEVGDYTYDFNQDEINGKVQLPTAATLLDHEKRHLESGLLGSLQQLHTEEPELILYDWVGDDDRARIEAWRTRLLADAAACWREHYDPEDFPDAVTAAAVEHGVDRTWITLAVFFNVVIWMWVNAWLLPEGTLRLLVPAIGTAAASIGEFAGQLICERSVRRALGRTWPLTAALLAISAAVSLWIGSGHFPGGAYS